MLTVDAFVTWLKTYRYTGPAFYGSQGTEWTVTSGDVDRWLVACERNPRWYQGVFDQGSCKDPKEGAAYLKYLDQAAKMYSANY